MRRLFAAALALGVTGGAANAQSPAKDFNFIAMPSGTGGHSLLRLLRRAEVVTHLSLSLYQQKAIKDLADEYQRQKMAILMELAEPQEDGDASSGQIRRAVRIDSSKLEKTGTPAYNKLSALKKEVDEKILGILSDEEKKAFEKVQGDPF